ncbi:hypothetical protein NE628_15515, partial [Coprococcus eutactus]|uniref:hypothetical protein n=1 Tax=Coprococcus eutactus TaxID=33043 RepID=UPI002109C96A
MAAKAGILTVIVAEAARGLVRRRYGGSAVAVPVLLAAVYIGRRGRRGVVRCSEAVFWFTAMSA